MPVLAFNKKFSNNSYELYFNTFTGAELLQGINGKKDPFKLELPSLLDIGIMGSCKNKCPFCYQGHSSEPNMKLDDFKKIIDETKHHVNQVALGGRGDPNKHENFKEMVEYARKNNVVPNYTTSGINLTDNEIEISKLCGAVAISDYETEHTFDAIKRLAKAGIKTNIHIIFSQVSFDKCIQILHGHNPWKVFDGSKRKFKYFVDLNDINGVIFLLFKPSGAGKILTGYVPTKYQIKVFSSLVLEPEAKFKIGMDSCLVNYLVDNIKITEKQKIFLSTCEASRMSAYITPDMKLMPCSFAERKIWAVPIRKTLKSTWNNSLSFKKFRKALKNKPQQCPLGL